MRTVVHDVKSSVSLQRVLTYADVAARAGLSTYFGTASPPTSYGGYGGVDSDTLYPHACSAAMQLAISRMSAVLISFDELLIALNRRLHCAGNAVEDAKCDKPQCAVRFLRHNV